jgi:hypothetical protein
MPIVYSDRLYLTAVDRVVYELSSFILQNVVLAKLWFNINIKALSITFILMYETLFKFHRNVNDIRKQILVFIKKHIIILFTHKSIHNSDRKGIKYRMSYPRWSTSLVVHKQFWSTSILKLYLLPSFWCMKHYPNFNCFCVIHSYSTACVTKMIRSTSDAFHLMIRSKAALCYNQKLTIGLIAVTAILFCPNSLQFISTPCYPT